MRRHPLRDRSRAGMHGSRARPPCGARTATTHPALLGAMPPSARAPHVARGALLAAGMAGPCACFAGATPRRACGRSTPTRRAAGRAPAPLAALASHRWRAGALRAPFSRSWPAAISAAPACRCSRARPGKAASRRLRRLRCAQALPGLCALAGRAVGARGRPGPVTGLGPSGPSAFAGRVSARPAATPPHWPARVAAPRPCASRRAGPGGCPACGPGRACGPRIFSRALLAGCLRCAQATRPFALRARRLRWRGLWPRTFVRVFTHPPASVAGG